MLKVAMYGNQGVSFFIKALINLGLDSYRETYFKLYITEKGVSLAYIDAIGRFKRDEVCNVQTIKNSNISINATNVFGTISLSGVTNVDNLVWTVELLN